MTDPKNRCGTTLLLATLALFSFGCRPPPPPECAKVDCRPFRWTGWEVERGESYRLILIGWTNTGGPCELTKEEAVEQSSGKPNVVYEKCVVWEIVE